MNRRPSDRWARCPNTRADGTCMYRGPCLSCAYNKAAHAKPRALYTFVGECRSPTAIRKGWTWADGRLAAKPLFEALEAMKIDLASVDFMNLWKDPRRGKPDERVIDEAKLGILVSLIGVRVIVALGARVSTELIARGIDHVALIHPAARGRIRKRHRYIAHVKERLS